MSIKKTGTKLIRSALFSLMFFTGSPAMAQMAADFFAGGGVRIGASTDACDAAHEGTLRYNDATNAIEFCDDNAWIMVGTGASGAAGADGEVQFNDGGIFGASSNFFWDNTNGRLGIGTATPAYPLDVYEGGDASAAITTSNDNAAGISAGAGFRALADATNINVFAHGTARTLARYGLTLGGWSEILGWGTTNGLVMGTNVAAPLVFGTNNLERMRIDSAGKVGIGTNTPAEKLDVIGNAYVQRLLLKSNSVATTSDISLSDNAFIETDASMYFSVDSDNNDIGRFFAFGHNSDDTTGYAELFRIQDDGRVGIGDTSPDSMLDVQGTASSPSTMFRIENYSYNLDSNTYGAYIRTQNHGTISGTNIRTTYGSHSRADNIMVEGTGHARAFAGYDIASNNGTSTAQYIWGNYAQALNYSTGLVDDARGVYGIANTDNGGGNITTAAGVWGSVYAHDGGTITNAYGVRGSVTETGAPIGIVTVGHALYADCNDAATCYGLKIAAGDAEVTTDWGVYVSGEDKNYFSGSVGIGNTSPNATLDVVGTTRTKQLQVFTTGAEGGEIQISDGAGAVKWYIDDVAGGLRIRQTGFANQLYLQSGTGNVGISEGAPTSKLQIAGDLGFNSTQGRGIKFWNNDAYKIYMSSATDGTWGGRMDATSDYNMYFRMTGGTNRGFVFQNATTELFQVDATGNLYAAGDLTMATGDITAKSLTVTDANGFMWENGVSRITHNDGGGNSQIKFGHEFDGSDVFTHGGGASEIVTNIDATSGTNMIFRVSSNPGAGTGNAVTWGSAMGMYSGGMKLASGATVNEFSTDTTLSGNSDTAVPTEKAVKAYVDAATGGLSSSWTLLGVKNSTYGGTCNNCDTGWDIPANATEIVYMVGSRASESTASSTDTYFFATATGCGGALGLFSNTCSIFRGDIGGAGSSTYRTAATDANCHIKLRTDNKNIYYYDGGVTQDCAYAAYYR